MGKIEDRLKELGIVLPRPPKAVANYLPAVKVGEILYVAGTIGTVFPRRNPAKLISSTSSGNGNTAAIIRIGSAPMKTATSRSRPLSSAYQ